MEAIMYPNENYTHRLEMDAVIYRQVERSDTVVSSRRRGSTVANEDTHSNGGLPPEMIMHILMFLQPHDLAHAMRTCKRIAGIARMQSVWKNLAAKAAQAQDIESKDICKYGWRALAPTLLRSCCFVCKAQPSFVLMFDNSRRCDKCLDTNADVVTQFVASELADIEEDGTGIGLAKFCLTIGRMGKLDVADAILDELLQKQESVHGKVSLPVANVLYYQAQVYRMRSNAIVFVDATKVAIARKARDALEQALTIREQVQHKESIDTANCLSMLGSFLITASHWTPEAEKKQSLLTAKSRVENAVNIYERLDDKRGLSQALKLLGGMYLSDGDEKKAVACIAKSLEMAQCAFGERDLAVADVMQYFGYLYWNLNREDVSYLTRSLEWHKKELDIREEVLGKAHAVTARAREDVCIILRKLGRDQEARAIISPNPNPNPAAAVAGAGAAPQTPAAAVAVAAAATATAVAAPPAPAAAAAAAAAAAVLHHYNPIAAVAATAAALMSVI
eukprot:TRINITY_DN5906_c0_g1_i1.p1 TRINITY_DN5906_c0_g1~~TRINITY_DN5906_c0_g1_i1.p1  ORF type:complete len:506 (+),score=62.31 TRINITY_DN5906_c0_g1_i1:360-1877(+)